LDKTDIICITAAVLAVIIASLFINGRALGLQAASAVPPYAARLFDRRTVHSIDILADEEEWNAILEHPRDKRYIPVTAVIDGETFPGVGLRVKGSNSLNQTLKYGSTRFSFVLDFNRFNGGAAYYGLDKLSLNASFQDNSFLKEVITYDMMAHTGVPAPLCSYSFITVNGADRGLYVAIEEIDEAFLHRNFGRRHGMLYKPEYKRLDDENSDVALIYTGDGYERYDNIFRKAVTDATDGDKRRLIEALRVLSAGDNPKDAVDIDAVLSYFAVQSFVVNLDGYLGKTGHNYFLYEKDGRLSMLPWDYNLAYGTYGQGMPEPQTDASVYVNQPIDTPAPFEIIVRRPMFYNLMFEAENVRRYHGLYQSFVDSYFGGGHFTEKIEELVTLISPYVQKDPTKFCSYEDFLKAADTFRRFCILRAESVRGQLSGVIPSTVNGQLENTERLIDASSIHIGDLGDFEDMERVRERGSRGVLCWNQAVSWHIKKAPSIESVFLNRVTPLIHPAFLSSR
jgi:hypothetical protein